jgi:hypothetical protein
MDAKRTLGRLQAAYAPFWRGIAVLARRCARMTLYGLRATRELRPPCPAVRHEQCGRSPVDGAERDRLGRAPTREQLGIYLVDLHSQRATRGKRVAAVLAPAPLGEVSARAD